MIDYNPTIQTERFDIFCIHITRNPAIGCGRDVYLAWFRDIDVPRSVCDVTLLPGLNYVDWIHVCAEWRRQGIATEVLLGIETLVGPVKLEGVTDSGKALVKSLERMSR